ncbi:MAG: multicopper oxidase domain-containing protein [Nocardioides sp.]
MALAVLGVGGFAGWYGVALLAAQIDTVGEVVFTRPLAIPPLAPSVSVDGVRTFDLTLQKGASDFGRGSPTPTWGINGPYLGPTLRARRGEEVRVRVTNRLDEGSTLHWHGMHLPAEMDGGPHQMVEPGEVWEPHWKIDQPAATLWYHPHPHGETARHIYRGLAGMFLIEDESADLALPHTYGVDDIPVVVQDKRFHDDGTLDEEHSFFRNVGIIGDTILVNGTVGPYLDVTTRAVRLRLLNASNARPYNFAFDDARRFSLIGTDGGLLESPVPLEHLQLSPGERAEIVVVVEPETTVRLQSAPTDTRDRLAGGEDRLDILQLRAADQLSGSAEVPDGLVHATPLEESDAQRTRSFDISGYSINGASMDMARIDEIVTVGDTEVWTVTNLDGATHNFHVHDVQFQILDIGGEHPPPHLAGWKDTVWLRPREEVRLIMSFSDYASSEWPYMFHCHILTHEDQGLMGQFLVVEPGTPVNHLLVPHDRGQEGDEQAHH